MISHHSRFVLRQYIEHKDPSNLRLHVWTYVISWLALTTLLSQIALPLKMPVLGANVGAAFTALSLLYWLPVDALVTAFVATITLAWAMFPFSLWGPGHGSIAIIVPLVLLATMSLARHYAHVYYHEHAEFLKGGNPLRAALDTAHAMVWGCFHFSLERLLHAGWRPKLKATLDERERRLLSIGQQVPWANWAGLASCRAQLVSTPQSVEDLVLAVREARSRGLRVRVVASGFSWSSLVPSNDALIFCERMNGVTVDVSDRAHPTVWVEAGVTNRQLNRALESHGLCMPWNVVLETVRIAGIASTGTHGTGKLTATVGDLVEAFEVVDAAGNLRVLSEETVGAETMNSVRLGLGLFGVIARIKLRVVPTYRVRQADLRLPMNAMLDQLPKLIDAHDSVELYWFPFNSDVWVRTIDRTDEPRTLRGHGFWFRAQNFLQNVSAIVFFNVVTRFLPSITPALLRIAMRMLPFRARILNLAESHHYHHWIEMMPCGCLEVGFKADADYANVRRAWKKTQLVVNDYAKRGLYPLNLSLNVRFIGSSNALLTPAYGQGLTCYIEIMWMGRPKGWAELSSELCLEWLKVPGAMPHWSKEFEHVPDVVSILRASLGDRRTRFLDALASTEIDPDRVFWNPLIHRLFADEVA